MSDSAITWQDVEAHDSALSSVNVSAQTEILNYVNTTLVVAEFGGDDDPRLRLARIYLAAHHGTIALQGSSAVGPVVSQTVGPISRTYAAISSGDGSGLDSTPWGRAYKDLVRSSPARAPFVV